jgi:bifunctional UDP-N-acetylglucosamine pyrophosphorylase/glucosamine-1-phosphate N-acetyltransferase
VKRVLIVPAAGRGSRLGGDTPKVLVPVNGRPMLDYILHRYRELVDLVLLVVHPDFADQVMKYVEGSGMEQGSVALFLQGKPTGMLDAILIPRLLIADRGPDEVWVTWCDQVAVSEGTAFRLAQAMATAPEPTLAFPTVMAAAPYIHFARDQGGRIVRVLQRREGDAMPADGEGDIGLFALSRHGYLDLLPEFARSVSAGAGTGERNFLPFIPWLASRAPVRTIPANEAIEAVGINTPEDLKLVSDYLASQSQ